MLTEPLLTSNFPKDIRSSEGLVIIEKFKRSLGIELAKYKKLCDIRFEPDRYKESLTCMDYYSTEEHNAFLILGTDCGTVWKFNPKTNDLVKLYKMKESQERISCVKISSSGKSVAVVYEFSVQVISVKDGECLNSITSPFDQARLSCVALTHDEKTLICGSVNQMIKIFDIQTETCVYSSEDDLETGKELQPVRSIVITEKDDCAIFGWGSNSIILFDLINNVVIHELKGFQEAPVITLAISSNSQFFVSGAEDGSLAVFNIEKKEYIDKFEGVHDGAVIWVTLTHDNNFILSTSSDDTIRVFDIQRKILVHTYNEPHNGIAINNSLRLIKLGKMISVTVTSGNKAIIAVAQHQFWLRSISSLKESDDMERLRTEYKIAETALSNSQDLVAVGSYEGNIYIYDHYQRNEVQRINFGSKTRITSIVFNTEDTQIIVGNDEGLIKSFDVKTGSLVHDFEAVHNNFVYLKLSPWNKRVYSGSSDRSIALLDVEKKEVVRYIKNVHQKVITSIAVSQNLFVTTGGDRCIKIFDSQLNYTDNELILYEGNPSCIAISKHESYVICGSSKGNLHIFNIKTFEPSIMIKAHKRLVYSVEISVNSMYLFSSSIDGTAKVFDIKRRELIYDLCYVPKEPSYLRLELSSDNSFLAYYCQGSYSIYITPNPFGKHDFGLIVSVTRQYSPFIVFEDYLLSTFFKVKDLSFQKEIIKAYYDLRVYPFGWNFFHIVAIFRPGIELIKLCLELGIPFSLDHENKTPLHYLLAGNSPNFALINYILENFHELIGDNNSAHVLISSLSDLLPKILAIDTPPVANFLKLAFTKPLEYKEEGLPTFGKVLDSQGFKYLMGESKVLNPEIKGKLIDPKGDELLSICLLMFFLDYCFISDQMFEVSKTLFICEEEEIFKTKAVSVLIDYLWEYAKIYHTFVFIFYSIGMLIVSLYVGLTSKSYELQILMLVYGSLYLIHEIIQILYAGKTLYFQDLWNNIDIITATSIISLPIVAFFNQSPFARSWLEAIVIALGFIRWVSFFRIFDNTRRLIRTIVEIIKDMRSFILVIISLIIGFTLIFHSFRPEEDFFFVMDQVYNLLYANSKFDQLSASEYFFFVIITVSLSVVLLNMLIAIMGDTYAKVQDTAVISDSKERMALIVETISILRGLSTCKCFPIKGMFGEFKQSYLYFAKEDINYDEALYGSTQVQWEGRFNNLKKFLKAKVLEQTGSLEKQYTAFTDDFVMMNEDIASIKRRLGRLSERVAKGRQKKQEKTQETAQAEILNPYLVQFQGRSLTAEEVVENIDTEETGDEKVTAGK